MDNNNTTPMQKPMNNVPPVSPMQAPKPEKKMGPVLGAVIILVILVIAALYFYSQRPSTSSDVTSTTDQTQAAGNTQLEGTPQQDDVNSINADLDAQLKDVDYSF